MHRFLIALCALALAGCAATFWVNDKSTTLNFGMSKQQVQQTLGPPQSVTTRQAQTMMVETWKYLDRTLQFQNGILQAWWPAGSEPADDGLVPAQIPASQ